MTRVADEAIEARLGKRTLFTQDDSDIRATCLVQRV